MATKASSVAFLPSSTPPVLSVVIPVYNEAGNIDMLVREVADTLRPHVAFEIIVVDDASRDGSDRCWCSRERMFQNSGFSTTLETRDKAHPCGQGCVQHAPSWWSRWMATDRTTLQTSHECWKRNEALPISFALLLAFVRSGVTDSPSASLRVSRTRYEATCSTTSHQTAVAASRCLTVTHFWSSRTLITCIDFYPHSFDARVAKWCMSPSTIALGQQASRNTGRSIGFSLESPTFVA